MSLSQSLLPEFDHEMANTRKVLERIPEDKLNWKVHEKSNTIGWVGMHMAGILGWVDLTLNRDSLDIAPVGAEPYRTPVPNSRQEILDQFDKNLAAARAAIATASDEQFMKPWSLLMKGEVRLYDASRGSAPQFCAQSYDPSPRPPVRLPAAERRPGARVVRAFGGRARHVAVRG